MDVARDWRLDGPDLAVLPFLRASWLLKTQVVPAPANDLDGPCWLWQGHCNEDGYGRVSIGPRVTRKLWYIHRWMFRNYYGEEIPPDFHVDHLCFRQNCFQFGHLRKLDMLTNSARHQRVLDPAPELSPEDLEALSGVYVSQYLSPVCSY
jgi:hypothetical protein